MIRVDIPHYDTFVEFPDGTPPEKMQETIKKNFPDKRNVLQKAEDIFNDVVFATVKTFKRTWEIQKKESQQGLTAMKEAITKPSLTSPLRAGLGALQYTLSPIESITEAFGGEPTTELLKAGGVREDVARAGGNLMKYGLQFLPAGQLAKSKVIADIPALQMEEKMRKLGVTPAMTQSGLKETAKEGLPKAEIVAKVETIKLIPKPEKTIAQSILKEGEEFLEPRLKDTVIKDVTQASIKSLEGNLDESQRIFKNIGRLLANEEIDAKSVPEILKKMGLTPEQFAKEFMDTASYFGRGLGRLGYVAKQLKFAFKDNPQAMQAFDDIIKKSPELEGFEKAFDMTLHGIQKMENTRRGLLVTQVATAMRNAWSQLGRITIGTLDDTFQGVLRGTVGGEGKTLDQAREGLSAFHAFWNKLTPSGRNKLNSVLETNHAVIEKTRLLSQPVHEVTLGSKVAQILNTGNRIQEIFFRKLAFEAKLRQSLSRKGLDFNTIDPKHIPVDDIKNSVDYALEMTFSASPKGQAYQQFIKHWSNSPLTTVNPFPRFGLYNAPKFLFEHSPLGYLHAFSPNTIKKLASGNPDVFAKAASRATLGSLMLMSAWQLRNSEYAGEKWYEIKAGDKTYDTRVFAPLSTYLFVAEAFSNPKNIKAEDWAMASIGLNRIAGTGLVLTDWLRTKDLETAKKAISTFIGQYAGSFTVPFRTPKDIVAGINDEESKIRDVRDNPLIGPILANIPYISQALPERPSPLKTGAMKTETPLLRQFTGFSGRTKTIIEKEVDKLQIDFIQILPSTGIPEADRQIARNMAPLVEKYMPMIIQTEKYKESSLPTKKLIFTESLKEIRQVARKQLILKNPRLGMQIYTEGMSKNIKELLKERGLNIKQ